MKNRSNKEGLKGTSVKKKGRKKKKFTKDKKGVVFFTSGRKKSVCQKGKKEFYGYVDTS